MQVVVAGQVEVGAVHLPHRVDPGGPGQIAVDGEDGVLVAHETGDAGLPRPRLVHPAPGMAAHSARRPPTRSRTGLPPERRCRRAHGGSRRQAARRSTQRLRTVRSAPSSSHSGMTANTKRYSLCALQRVGQQHQEDQRQQQPITPRGAQRAGEAQCAQPAAGERQPPRILVPGTLAGAHLAQNQVEAQVGDVGVEQVAVPGQGIEHADRAQTPPPPPRRAAASTACAGTRCRAAPGRPARIAA